MFTFPEPKSYVDLLHQNFAPFMEYTWAELWDFVRATATTRAQWAEIAVIAGLDIESVRLAITKEKGLSNIDAITYSMGFCAGSGGTPTIVRFASETAVLAHALDRLKAPT